MKITANVDERNFDMKEIIIIALLICKLATEKSEQNETRLDI